MMVLRTKRDRLERISAKAGSLIALSESPAHRAANTVGILISAGGRSYLRQPHKLSLNRVRLPGFATNFSLPICDLTQAKRRWPAKPERAEDGAGTNSWPHRRLSERIVACPRSVASQLSQRHDGPGSNYPIRTGCVSNGKERRERDGLSASMECHIHHQKGRLPVGFGPSVKTGYESAEEYRPVTRPTDFP